MDIMKSTLIGLVLLILVSSNALAHKVNVFAYAENGMVYTESYFSDGKKVMDSTVEVFDAQNNKLLLTGKTDKNGEFSFKIPQATGLRIVLTASMGHKNEYFLSEGEVRDAMGIAKLPEKSPPERVETEKMEELPETVTQVYGERWEALMEQVVEKKTAPIMRKLLKIEEQMQKPSLQDIIGGLGYIVGLMGIGIYFRYKRKH
jgi:nickel transport protein